MIAAAFRPAYTSSVRNLGRYEQRSGAAAVRRSFAIMASNPNARVTRVTLFKIPHEEDREALAKMYETVSRDQKKDGKPYILSIEAGPLSADSLNRNGGYTFVCKTVFKDRADFDFYDKECEAHAALKVGAKTLRVEGPPQMVFFSPSVVGGTGL